MTKMKLLLLVGATAIAAIAWFTARRETTNDWATFTYWNYRFADADTTQPLFVIRVNGRQGFMDRNGQVVIEPTFNKVYPFTNGLAAVMVGEKWGYIDEMGAEVIPPTYAMAGLFREGRAPVRMELTESYGYVDKTGKMVIPPQFDAASDFIDGVARVGFQTTLSKITSRFADIGIDCSYHYIDLNGNTVAKPALTNPPIAKTHPLTPIKIDGKMGFADADGNIVIKPQFDYVDEFENGLSLFTIDRGARSGYVDETGKIIWPASN